MGNKSAFHKTLCIHCVIAHVVLLSWGWAVSGCASRLRGHLFVHSHLCLEAEAAVSGEQGGQSTALSRAMEEQLCCVFLQAEIPSKARSGKSHPGAHPYKAALIPNHRWASVAFHGEKGWSLCALFQLSVSARLPPPLLQILPHSPPGESLQCQSLYKQILLWAVWRLRQTWPQFPLSAWEGMRESWILSLVVPFLSNFWPLSESWAVHGRTVMRSLICQ